MKHYTEVDLLETYYTAPGESMPVMMHLAECGECAARYQRLESKLRSAAGSCDVESRPPAFWARQRNGIQQQIAGMHAGPGVRYARIAAAVALSFALGGALVYQTSVVPLRHATPSRAASAGPAASAPITTSEGSADEMQLRDPWESEELSDFHNVVSWESWVAESGASTADGSSL